MPARPIRPSLTRVLASARTRLGRLRLVVLAALVTLLVAAVVGAPTAQGVTYSQVTGAGSTYVGIAMRQWVAQGQAQGWGINYSPVGSPTGMSLYNQSQAAFAATEAEFSSLGYTSNRSYQYVPDVAGGTAIMYNIKDGSGRQVDYLHLDRATVARIFTGEITNWSDPRISATNKGIVFPNMPIRVVLRGNASGTTALFYDFIAKTLGSEYTSRFAQYGCGQPDRPIQISCSKPGYLPSTISFNDSDQIAQYIANSATGAWSIAFDEFGYAKVYSAPTAWIQNASGKYVLPYAQNISAALESARLRADLSQDLSGVYASSNPAAYPISAYSYLVTQCAPTSARATCRGGYSDAGQSATLAAWMRYIACDGQVTMAAQGYSPLPANLSQEMANSVGRLTGTAAEQLTSANCSNPRFKGSLGNGASSPCDPFVCGAGAGSSTGGGGGGGSAAPTAPAGTGSRTGSGGSSGSSASGGTTGGTSAGSGRTTTGSSGSKAGTTTGAGSAAGSSAATGTSVGGAAAGQQSTDGRVVAIGGGSDAASWRSADPVSFSAAVPGDPFGWLPAVLVLAAIVLPLVWGSARRSKSPSPERRRDSRT